jgi:hypothetical protein
MFSKQGVSEPKCCATKAILSLPRLCAVAQTHAIFSHSLNGMPGRFESKQYIDNIIFSVRDYPLVPTSLLYCHMNTILYFSPRLLYFSSNGLLHARLPSLGIHWALRKLPTWAFPLSKATFIPNRITERVTAHVSDEFPMPNGACTISQH